MRGPISSLEKSIATLVLLLAAAAFVYLYFLVSSFEELFRDVDVVIPRRTQLVLDTYVYWSVFPIVALGGHFLVCWYGNQRGWYLLLASTLAAAILFPVTIWAMYGPVTG
jgi:hypothetical protein